jgi:hypothetical protein
VNKYKYKQKRVGKSPYANGMNGANALHLFFIYFLNKGEKTS